jgi:4-amino-4-deoxy-L-arabinose transferase-like glycosyltransferase
MARLKGKRLDLFFVLALFAGGLLLHLLLLAPFRFDGLYGQDSYSYFDFAGELRRVVSEGHRPGPFFWPLGYPLLLAVFGTQAGQTINVLLGTLLAPLVYVLARQIGCRAAGAFAAGVLIAICGQALQSSLVLMADIPSLAWALVSAISLWQYTSGRRRGWLMVAFAALALASITRWLYLVLIIPWGAVLIFSGRLRWREWVIASVPAVLIFGLQLLYSSTSQYPTLNHSFVEGWSVSNIFQRKFTNADGHFVFELENWRYYAQPFYDSYYLAPIFTPFLLVGLAIIFKWRQVAQAALLTCWALLPYIFLAGIPFQNIRFPLIIFPAVAILAGAGLEGLLQWARQHRLTYAGWLVFVAVLLIGGRQMLLAAQTNIDTFIANQQRDKDAAAWAGEQVPAGATLYTFGLTLTLKHYTMLDVYEIYYETPETLEARWVRGRDDYLMLNVWNIENQWAGRGPQLDFHWLRDTRGLVEMGRYGNYTLYRIEG